MSRQYAYIAHTTSTYNGRVYRPGDPWLPGIPAVKYLSTRLDMLSAGSMGSLPFLIPMVAAGAILKLLRDRTRLFWFGAGFLIAAVFFLFGGGV